MGKRSSRAPGSPYKVLYWLGAGVLVMLAGVLALVFLLPSEPRVAPDPERTLLWVYDPADPDRFSAAAVVEESRSRGTLVAVPFTPSDAARRRLVAEKSPLRAHQTVAAELELQVHRRVFLPIQVLAVLIDAAGGITVDGQRLTGAGAVEYIESGGGETARRNAAVLLALSDAAMTRGISLGLNEGLDLAQQINTNMDITLIPNVLARWSKYQSRVAMPASDDPANLRRELLPDPVPDAEEDETLSHVREGFLWKWTYSM